MKVSKLLRGLRFALRVAAGAAAQGAQSVALTGLEDALAEQLGRVDGVAAVSVDRPVTSGGLARTYRARLTLIPGLDAAGVSSTVERCQAIFDEGRARSVLDPRLEVMVPVDDATVLLTTSRWKHAWNGPVDDTALQALLDEARVGGGTAEASDGDVRLRFTAPLEAVAPMLLDARPSGVGSWLRSWESDGASVDVRSAAAPTSLRPTLFQALVGAGVQRIHIAPENRRSALRPPGDVDDQQAARWLAMWRTSITDDARWRVSVETIGAWCVTNDEVVALTEPHTSEEWRARSARIAALLDDE